MKLICETEQTPTHHLVRIVGNVDMAAVPELEQAFNRLVAARPGAVVLDLSQMSFIGSLGIGAIFHLHKAIVRYGGVVRFAAPQPMVADAFARVRLYEVLDVRDTLQSAQTFDSP